MRVVNLASIILILMQASCFNNEEPKTTGLNANPPVQLSISSEKSPLIEGLCSGVNVVNTLDKDGNPAKVTYEQTFRLTSTSPHIKFYTDGNCESETRAIKIAANKTEGFFYVKMNKAEYVTYIVSGNNYSAAAESKTALSQNAAIIKVDAPSSVQTGLCSERILIEPFNYKGEKSVLTQDVEISLSGNGLGKFYSSSDCSGSAIASVKISSGFSQAEVFFKTNKTNEYNLIFTAPGPITVNTVMKAVSGVPSKMIFANSPKSLIAGNCSDNYRIDFLDSLNNYTVLSASKKFDFNGSEVLFFSDPNCSGSPITSKEVEAGSASLSFYVKATKVESDLITVTGFGEQKQSLSVLAAGPDKLKITGISPQGTAGKVFNRIDVRIEDVFGNRTTSNKRVDLAAFKDSSCLDLSSPLSGVAATNAIAGQAGFSTISYTKAENIYIRASSEGVKSDCSSVITVFPEIPSKLAISSKASIAVNSCNKISVSPVDSYGNISPLTRDTVVTVSSFGRGGFFSDEICENGVSPNKTIFSGSESTDFYFKDQFIEDINLRFSGLGASPSLFPLKVISSEATKFIFNIPTAGFAGQCNSGLILKTVDDNGYESTVSSDEIFNFELASGKLYSDRDCSNAINGSFSILKNQSLKQFFYKGTLAGNHRLNISGMRTSLEKYLNIVPGQAKRINFISGSSYSSTEVITPLKARILDDFGNNVTSNNTDINLTIFSDASCTTAISGNFSGSLLKKTISGEANFDDLVIKKVGVYYIKPSSIGLESSCFGPISIVPSLLSKVKVSEGQNIEAGKCSDKITILFVDENDNNRPIDSDFPISILGAGTANLFNSSDCSGDPIANQFIVSSGQDKAEFYLKGINSSSIELKAKIDSLAIESQSETFTIYPGKPEKLNISGPTLVDAQECSSKYEISLEDRFGNLTSSDLDTIVSGSLSGSAALFKDSSCNQPASSVTIKSGETFSNFYLKGEIAETFSFSVSSGNTITPKVLENIKIAALGPSKLKIQGPVAVIAGNCTQYNITTKDVFGNDSFVRAASEFSFNDLGSGKVYLDDNCLGSPVSKIVFNENEFQKYFYYKNTKAGTEKIKTSGFGSASDEVTVNISNSTLNKLVFLNEPKNIIAGQCSTEFTLASQDFFGNSVSVDSNKEVAISGPGIEVYSDQLCSVPVLENKLVLQKDSSIIKFYLKSIYVSTESVFVTSDFSSINQLLFTEAATAEKIVFDITPTTGSPNLVSSFTSNISLSVADRFGNTKTNASNNIAIEAYSDNNCNIRTYNSSFVGDTAKNASNGTVQFFDISYNYPEVIYIKASSPEFSPICSTAIPIIETIPSYLELLSETNFDVGSCSLIRVTAFSRFGTIVNIASPLPFDLSVDPDVKLYSNENCSVEATNSEKNISAGESGTSFWVRETRAKPATIVLSSELGDKTKEIEFKALSPTKIGFSYKSKIFVNQCNKISVEKQDIYGNSSSSADTELAVLSAAGQGLFYENETCNDQITEVIIPENLASTDVYYFNSVPGPSTISATGYENTESKSIFVSRPDPKKILLSATPSHVSAGSCTPVYVITADEFDTPVVVDNEYAVELISNLTDEHSGFYSSSDCTGERITQKSILAENDRVLVYLKTLKKGTFTFGINRQGVSTSPREIIVTPGAPVRLGFLTTPPEFIAKETEFNLSSGYFDAYDNIIIDSNSPPIGLSIVSAINGSDLSGQITAEALSKTPDPLSGVSAFEKVVVLMTGRVKFKIIGGEFSHISETETFIGGSSLIGVKISGQTTTSIRGDTVVSDDEVIFGAPDEEECGVVFVFKNNSTDVESPDFIFSQKIKPRDCLAGLKFGSSISKYRNHLLIGAPSSEGSAGKAFLFSKDEQSGSYVNKKSANEDLVFNGAQIGDKFGYSVSISSGHFVVGAPGSENNKGKVKIFSYIETLESFSSQEITLSNASAGDNFGESVSIYSGFGYDGNFGFLAAGSPGKNSNSGQVTVYRRVGLNFIDEKVITSSLSSASPEMFGKSVSIFGPILAVGAPNADSGTGRVYVYKNTNDVEYWMNNNLNNWGKEVKLTPFGVADGAKFGTSVDVFGNHVVVGAPNDVGSNKGKLYVFDRNLYEDRLTNGSSSWVNSSFMNSNYSEEGDLFVYAGFGESVAIFKDKVVSVSNLKGYVSFSRIPVFGENNWPFGFDGDLVVNNGSKTLTSNKIYDFLSVKIDAGKKLIINQLTETPGWSIIGTTDSFINNGEFISLDYNSGFSKAIAPDEFGVSSGKVYSKWISPGFGGKGGGYLSSPDAGKYAFGGAGGDGGGSVNFGIGGMQGKNGGLVVIHSSGTVSGSGQFNLSGSSGTAGGNGIITATIDNEIRVKTTGTCSLFEAKFARTSAGSCYSTWVGSPREASVLSGTSRWKTRYNQSSLDGISLEYSGQGVIHHIVGTGFHVSGNSSWNTEQDPDCLNLLKASLSFSSYPGTEDVQIQTSFGPVNVNSCNPIITPGDGFLCDESGEPHKSFTVKFSCNYVTGETINSCGPAGGGGGGGGSGGKIILNSLGANSILENQVNIAGGSGAIGGNAASESSCIAGSGEKGDEGFSGDLLISSVGVSENFVGSSLPCSVPGGGTGERIWLGQNYSECKNISCPNNFALFEERCVAITKPCLVSNGAGEKIWDIEGKRYGKCTAECSLGFESVDGICSKKCEANKHRNLKGLCEDNVKQCDSLYFTGQKSWDPIIKDFGECAVGSCKQNYHLEGGTCVPNTRSCILSSGIGVEVWNSTNLSYEGCSPFSCNSGYHLEQNQCLPNTKSCFIENGIGELTWLSQLGDYSSCATLISLSYSSNELTLLKGVLMEKLTPISVNAVVFSVTPQLPNGIELNSLTGEISGIPSEMDERKPYTISARTSSGLAVEFAIAITINERPPSNLSYSAQSATYTRGVQIQENSPTSTGGDITSYTITPNLPNGLSINAITGVISGTPATESPNLDYIVTAKNTAGEASFELTIKIVEQAPYNLTYTTQNAVYTKGSTIGLNIPSAGGGPISNYIISKPLPEGLNLDPVTGEISGTPSLVSSEESFIITAKNSGGETSSLLQITVNDALPGFSYGIGNYVFSKGITVPEIVPSKENVTQFTISPPLPDGLIFNQETGAISGVPINISLEKNYLITAINSTGQQTNSSIKVSISDRNSIFSGGKNTCKITQSGGVRCWGSNEYGQLGSNSISFNWTATLNASTPNSPISDVLASLSPEEKLANVIKVSIGEDHICALIKDGKINCWGKNTIGQLGNGTTTNSNIPVEVSAGEGESYVDVAAGKEFTCGILSSGSLKCWGKNNYGQLGNGGVVSSNVPVSVPNSNGVKFISAGFNHSCAIFQGGVLKCWGKNSFGQIGSRQNDVVVIEGELNVEAAPLLTEIEGNFSGIKSASIGEDHTCFVSSSEDVKCFGRNNFGQLGSDSISYESSTLSPVSVPGVSSVKALSSGKNNNCVVSGSGLSVVCWGSGQNGALGNNSLSLVGGPSPVWSSQENENQLGSIISISSGEDNSCAVKSTGQLFCWGSNNFGQLGFDPRFTASSIVPISANSYNFSLGSQINQITSEKLSIFGSPFVLSGSLPQGLSFNSEDGIISGLPTLAGEVSISMESALGQKETLFIRITE